MKQINKKGWYGILIIVILVIVAFVIFKKPVDNEKIKVGALFSMTGFGQMYGEETKRGFETCKNDNIELIVEDSQSSPTVGVTAFNKLVNIDKPDIILVMLSSVAESTLPLIKNYNGPILATSVITSNITERGGEKYFRYFSRGESESDMAAKYLLNDLKIKKLGVLYLNSDFGKVYLNGISEVYKNNGQIFSESFNTGTIDFKTQIIKLKENGVEGIYIAGYDNDLILSLKDIRNLKYNGVIFTNSVFTNILAKDIDKNTVEGVYFSGLKFFTDKKVNDPFYSSYKNKYNIEPNWYSSMGCDIARQINQAKNKDLFNYYKNLSSFDGLNGKIIKTGRELEITEDVAIYKDGQIKILKITN